MFMHSSWLFAIVAGVFSMPAFLLLLEVAAGCCSHRGRLIIRRNCTVAVLVPAHNESAGIRPTLTDIKAQLRSTDRIVVVADNCDDDTANVAQSEGAEVLVRNNTDKIGKGFALDYGLRHISADPPEILIVIDADCRLKAGALDALASSAIVQQRPAQSLYLMQAPDSSPIKFQVAEFAWRVKNWARPDGLAALGLPCQLMGSGMAFPWNTISAAPVASGSIVEDIRLGLDLAARGASPMFCPSAVVTSQFPTTAAGADTQRQRWVHGHLHTMVTALPGYAARSIQARNLSLFILCLDLIIPPMALLLIVLTVLVTACITIVFLDGSMLPLAVSLSGLAAYSLAVVLAWTYYGRDILPLRSLPSIIPYIFNKVGIYARLAKGQGVTKWIRTDRSGS